METIRFRNSSEIANSQIIRKGLLDRFLLWRISVAYKADADNNEWPRANNTQEAFQRSFFLTARASPAVRVLDKISFCNNAPMVCMGIGLGLFSV